MSRTATPPKPQPAPAPAAAPAPDKPALARPFNPMGVEFVIDPLSGECGISFGWKPRYAGRADSLAAFASDRAEATAELRKYRDDWWEAHPSAVEYQRLKARVVEVKTRLGQFDADLARLEAESLDLVRTGGDPAQVYQSIEAARTERNMLAGQLPGLEQAAAAARTKVAANFQADFGKYRQTAIDLARTQAELAHTKFEAAVQEQVAGILAAYCRADHLARSQAGVLPPPGE